MQISFRPIRSLLAAALAIAAAPAIAQDGTFSKTVFFGDSLTDAGFFTPLLVQQNPQAAVLGRFTTNPGLVWAEFLADYYGTGAAMAWTATGATPRPGTGTNYAAGGARVGQNTTGALGFTPSLATQVNAYLGANGGRADADALYTVWGGANDLFAAAATPAQAQQIVGAAVTAQVGLVGALRTAGARYILVPTIPDVGLAPDFNFNPALSAQGSALANGYNTALFGALAQNGLSVIPVDTFNFLREVVASPATYGFINVTARACQPPGSSSLTCSPANFARPDAQYTYLFADGVHPSLRAHELVADLAVSMIEGPRQMALLPHVATTVGRARADMVSTQMTLTTGEADGTRWWVDGRYDGQRNGPDSSADLYDGGGGGYTVGVDWTRSGMVYGVFGGYSHQIMDWGLRKGDFRQDDVTLGGYAGWSGERAWVNAQLAYTQLDYELHRKVRLGPATRAYDSDTDGSNVSAGINAGWTFGDGAFTHGPVVGLLAQRIEIDGFAEDRPNESTSLAYPDQEYDALTGSAGWRANFKVSDHFEPFVRVTWNKEFEDDAEQARAQAQSIPGSLPYAVPGVAFDDTYGTVTYGARTELWGMELLSGSSLAVGQKDGGDSSFFLTLRGAF
jgi:outer membrane lipase/esterase